MLFVWRKWNCLEEMEVDQEAVYATQPHFLQRRIEGLPAEAPAFEEPCDPVKSAESFTVDGSDTQ